MRKIMQWVMTGLIIDVGRSAESAIGKLAAQAKEESNKGRYLLQSSFEHE